MLRFLSRRPVQLVTALLFLQIAFFYSRALTEYVPQARALSTLPVQFNDWKLYQEGVTDKDVLAQLKADDTLNRTYASPDLKTSANLFVAFYKTQRAGVSPHSPKVCLPGSGWMPLQSDTVAIALPGRPDLHASRYVVSRGESKSLVIYWFQTAHRSISNEYIARLYLVADGLRYKRSDTALVRVVVPVVGDDSDAATRAASDFIRSLYNPLVENLPS